MKLSGWPAKRLKSEKQLAILKDAAYAANAAWQEACVYAGLNQESSEADNLPEALVADDAWDAYEEAQRKHNELLQKQKVQKRRHYELRYHELKRQEAEKAYGVRNEKGGSNQSDINLFTTFAPTFVTNEKTKTSYMKESVEQVWLSGWDPIRNRAFKEPKYYPNIGNQMFEAKYTKQEIYDILIKNGTSPEEAEYYIDDFRDYGSGGRGGFLEGNQFAPSGPQVK